MGAIVDVSLTSRLAPWMMPKSALVLSMAELLSSRCSFWYASSSFFNRDIATLSTEFFCLSDFTYFCKNSFDMTAFSAIDL